MEILSFFSYWITVTAIYSIFALSLNFQYGHVGLVNFGQVFFFCLGAYTVAIANNIGVNFFSTIILAMVICGSFGFIVSFTARNMGGTYWGIATLAIGEIVRLIFSNERWLAGGANGISLSNQVPFFTFIVFVFTISSFLLINIITQSPFGRVCKTIREGDDLPLSLGKTVLNYKKKTMIIGGILGGLAGGLFAYQKQFVSPEDFMPIETFIVWAMIVLGGKGRILGTLLGTTVIQVFYTGTRFAKDYLPVEGDTLAALRMIVIGLLIMLVTMYKRNGMLPEKKKIYRVS